MLKYLEKLGEMEPPAHDAESLKQFGKRLGGAILKSDLGRIGEDDREAFEQLLGKVKAHVSQGDLGRQEIGLIMETAMRAEQFDPDLAVRACQGFAKILAASPNRQIAALGVKLQGAARRLTLVGKPMELAGQTLAGKPLDWPKYRGKVVLVTFWATWCGPCREEIKNIGSSGGSVPAAQEKQSTVPLLFCSGRAQQRSQTPAPASADGTEKRHYTSRGPLRCALVG